MPANPSPTYAKPPAPPAPPPTKIIKEGWGKDFCKVCSSSVNHSFLGTYLGCIQPKCSEYFEKQLNQSGQVCLFAITKLN